MRFLVKGGFMSSVDSQSFNFKYESPMTSQSTGVHNPKADEKIFEAFKNVAYTSSHGTHNYMNVTEQSIMTLSDSMGRSSLTDIGTVFTRAMQSKALDTTQKAIISHSFEKMVAGLEKSLDGIFAKFVTFLGGNQDKIAEAKDARKLVENAKTEQRSAAFEKKIAAFAETISDVGFSQVTHFNCNHLSDLVKQEAFTQAPIGSAFLFTADSGTTYLAVKAGVDFGFREVVINADSCKKEASHLSNFSKLPLGDLKPGEEINLQSKSGEQVTLRRHEHEPNHISEVEQGTHRDVHDIQGYQQPFTTPKWK